MSLAEIRLDDKYRLATGHLYLTGTQALTRLPMLQHQRDQARGLNTGGFISGYRGSPLGGLDKSLWEARNYLKQHAIHFQPGVNEELAATAVWGSQQTNLFPGARYDGVFAMWYGRGRASTVPATCSSMRMRRVCRPRVACCCWRVTTTAANPRRCRTRASMPSLPPRFRC